jgi:hypothetical protein
MRHTPSVATESLPDERMKALQASDFYVGNMSLGNFVSAGFGAVKRKSESKIACPLTC